MTSSADDTLDIGATVRALMPQLRQQAMLSVILIVALGIATCAMTIWALQIYAESSQISRFATTAAMFCLVGMLLAWRRARHAQEALVMPVLAQAVGLSYDKNAKAFLAGLPRNLLPQKAAQSAEDHVHGRLGNHRIDMAEVRVVTGGKNSKTLFKGLVAQFPNSVPMPIFFLAPLSKTKPGVIFSAWMPTEGLTHLRDVTGPSGTPYGVWISWTERDEPPALAAVIKVLTDLETRVGVSASLFSVVSTGNEMFVALSHSGDLYRIGGLFPSEARIFGDVSSATQELAVVLNLARQLIAAEEAAVGASVKMS